MKGLTKKNHGMSIGDQKEFKNFQELQDFCDEFTYRNDEFDFISSSPLIIQKTN